MLVKAGKLWGNMGQKCVVLGPTEAFGIEKPLPLVLVRVGNDCLAFRIDHDVERWIGSAGLHGIAALQRFKERFRDSSCLFDPRLVKAWITVRRAVGDVMALLPAPKANVVGGRRHRWTGRLGPERQHLMATGRLRGTGCIG